MTQDALYPYPEEYPPSRSPAEWWRDLQPHIRGLIIILAVFLFIAASSAWRATHPTQQDRQLCAQAVTRLGYRVGSQAWYAEIDDCVKGVTGR